MDVELLEEISERLSLPPMRPPGFGFTLSEFVRKNKMLRERAMLLLEEMIDEGGLEKMEMRYATGRGGLVYFRKGTWPPKQTTS